MAAQKILLVDDEPHIPMVVGRKLEAAGYDVVTAADGEEGLAAAKDVTPDLIITDLQMPFMSGVELAKALKGEDGLQDIPVILLTARGYVLPDAERATANISRVLAKPFSVSQILDLVRETLGGARHSEAA